MLIIGGVILGVLLIDHFIAYGAQASASCATGISAAAACQKDLADSKASYDSCLNLRYAELVDHYAATDFLIKNYARLEFPSCFKDLTYMTTGEEDILYISNGNYLGWTSEESDLYCWNNNTYFFDCEELCSGLAGSAIKRTPL